jgi:anti-anti-sigma factor
MPATAIKTRGTITRRTVRVVLAGELDLTARPALYKALFDAVTRPRVRHVEVDLRAVTFLDCSSIAVFVAAHGAAHRQGISMHLTQAHGLPLRVLRLTGLQHLLASAPVSARVDTDPS